MEQFSILRPANVKLPRRTRTLAQVQALLDAYTQAFSSRSTNTELAQDWVDELEAACERLDDNAAVAIREALRIYALQRAKRVSAPTRTPRAEEEMPVMA
jgi:hypothetical protein